MDATVSSDLAVNVKMFDQLPKPALLELLEFVFICKDVQDEETLNQSIQRISRSILQNNDVKTFYCCAHKNKNVDDSSLVEKQFGTCNNKELDSEIKSVIENSKQSFPPKRLINPKDSKVSTRTCASSCSTKESSKNISKSKNNSRSADFDALENIIVECIGKKDDNRLCLLSTNEQPKPNSNAAHVMSSLLPYIDEAFSRLAAKNSIAKATPSFEKLTKRENEVLSWVAQGKGCWEVGTIVGISERTVKFHLQNIYRKLNVVNRAQAIAFAMRENILD